MKSDILEQPGLMDFLQRIVGCHFRAHARMLECLKKENWEASVGARGALFHGFVMEEAKFEFENDPDIIYREHNQLKTLTTPWFQLRVKKATRHFSKMALNRTAITMVWIQQPLSEEIAPPDKVFLGYTVSRDWKQLLKFALVEFRNKEIYEVIDIPIDVEAVPTQRTGDFIDTPFRIKEDGIERTRREEMFTRELEPGSDSGTAT